MHQINKYQHFWKFHTTLSFSKYFISLYHVELSTDLLYQSIIIFDCHMSQFWDLEKKNNTTLVQSDGDQFVSPYQHRGTFTTSRRMKVTSTNTLNDKYIPYHSGNTWAIIYISAGPLASASYNVVISWWNTQLMLPWRTLSDSTLSRVPVFQFITFTSGKTYFSISILSWQSFKTFHTHFMCYFYLITNVFT